MSKKTCAMIVSVLFYVGAFMVLWEIMLWTSVGDGLVFVGFPLAAACYFVIAGTLFHRYLQVNRWHLWLLMNGIGYPLCWIVLTIRIPGIWFNLAIILFFIPITMVLAVVWGIVGIGFLCVFCFLLMTKR